LNIREERKRVDKREHIAKRRNAMAEKKEVKFGIHVDGIQYRGLRNMKQVQGLMRDSKINPEHSVVFTYEEKEMGKTKKELTN
jgi:hypothetical protein